MYMLVKDNGEAVEAHAIDNDPNRHLHTFTGQHNPDNHIVQYTCVRTQILRTDGLVATMWGEMKVEMDNNAPDNTENDTLITQMWFSDGLDNLGPNHVEVRNWRRMTRAQGVGIVPAVL